MIFSDSPHIVHNIYTPQMHKRLLYQWCKQNETYWQDSKILSFDTCRNMYTTQCASIYVSIRNAIYSFQASCHTSRQSPLDIRLMLRTNAICVLYRSHRLQNVHTLCQILLQNLLYFLTSVFPEEYVVVLSCRQFAISQCYFPVLFRSAMYLCLSTFYIP